MNTVIEKLELPPIREFSDSKPAKQPIKKISSEIGMKKGHGSTAATEDEVFITQKGGKILQGKSNSSSNVFKKQNEQKLSSTLLMQKKRELESVQLDLDKKRAEVMKKMEEIREQREGLKSKQKQLKERVAKFEKFLAEGHAKRQRALVKVQNERKLRLLKEEEIKQIKEKLVVDKKKNKHILENIKSYQKYENYLQSVIKILPANYFNTNEPSINDILLRHKTLHETNIDLVQAIEQNQQDIEVYQEKLSKIIKEKDDTVLVFNSMLGSSQKEYDKLVQDGQMKEQRQDEYYKSVKEKLRILGETKLAIHSLYERVMMIPWLANNQHSDNTKQNGMGQLMNNMTGGLNGNNGNVVGNLGSVDVMDTKLHTIREKLIDLKNLTDKAQQLTHGKYIGKQSRAKLL